VVRRSEDRPLTVLDVIRIWGDAVHKYHSSQSRRCAARFAMIFPRQKPAFFRRILPQIMPLWGKDRVANGGDKISTALAQEGRRGAIRDASFVT